MSDQKTASTSNRRKLIVAIIAILLLVGGIAYATGNNGKDDKKDTKTTQNEKKDDKKSEENKNGEVEGATVVTPGNTEYTGQGSSKPAATVASVSTQNQPTTPTPQTQQPAPQTPVTPPTEEPEQPPTEEPEEEYITVVAGGRSESFTFSTEDGSLVKWGSCNEGVVFSDEETPEKPGFQVYLVMEEGGDMTMTSSVTFHVRAKATATPGLYLFETPGYEDFAGLALCAFDENNNQLGVIDLPVTVLPSEEV
jgi:hypothetical protein